MKTEGKADASREGSTWTVTVAKLSVVVLLIVLGNIAAMQLIDSFEVQIWPEHLEVVERAVLIGVILYIGLMATPFLPGVEIGLALMTMLGPKGILLAYVCTLVALTVSFAVGRLIPTYLLIRFLHWLHLERAATLLEDFDATLPEERLRFLTQRFPARTVPALLNRRYLILAVLLNLPGNAFIGGGGGIGLVAGMSRIYSFPMYLAVIAIAIVPLPVMIMLSRAVS
jgi:hypothetical protein